MQALVPMLALAGSLLVALLSGVNQVAGFFGRVSIPTALLSLVLALVVAAFFPTLLHRSWSTGSVPLRLTPRTLSLAVAAAIVLTGVVPLGVKLGLAWQARHEGSLAADLHRPGRAIALLGRAARYYTDLGLPGRAARVRVPLALAYVDAGEFDKADALIGELERGAENDASLRGRLFLVRAIAAQKRGELERAERFYLLGHDAIEAGSRDEAVLLQNEAALWLVKGASRDRVLDALHRARDIYTRLDDRSGLAQLLINEGDLYESEPDKARALYEQARRLAEASGDALLLGTATLNIGLTYRQQGDYEQAEQHYQVAEKYFRQAAHTLGLVQVEINRGALESARGRDAVARQHVISAEAMLRELTPESRRYFAREIAQLRTFQADLLVNLGESQAAETRYHEALELYGRFPDPLHEANARVNYGGLLLRLNRAQEARNAFQSAREVLRSVGGGQQSEALGVVLNNIAEAYVRAGDSTSALPAYQEALHVFQALGERYRIAQVTENIALIRIREKGDPGGREMLHQALAIYREIGNHDHEVQTLFNLYASDPTRSDKQGRAAVREILALLDAHQIDQRIQAGVLFGILVQDIGTQQELITYRERLRQLKNFYEQRHTREGIGRALLRLAGVEQRLGNPSSMRALAAEAAEYAKDIPLPARISFHSDLGFYLFDPSDPEPGLDQFWSAFDLSAAASVEHQRMILTTIGAMLAQAGPKLDRDKQRNKLRAVRDNSSDAGLRSMADTLMSRLRE